MKCLECGKQTKGRDHNKRGLRCTFCWALLPGKAPKPKRKQKPQAEVEMKPKPNVAAGEAITLDE